MFTAEQHFRCPARSRHGKLNFSAWGTAMIETKPKRRWFTVSLRTLLLVMTVLYI